MDIIEVRELKRVAENKVLEIILDFCKAVTVPVKSVEYKVEGIKNTQTDQEGYRVSVHFVCDL
jgi:hypothetical protein